MSNSNESDNVPTLTDELASLDNLKQKLLYLEKIRSRQNMVKTVGILAILGLILYISYNLYDVYHNFDSEKFTKAVGNELETTFKPRLQNLHKKSESDLMPLIHETATKMVEKKLPLLQKRLEDLVEKVRIISKEKIEVSVANMLHEIEKGLQSELGENDFALVVDNDEFEDIVAEELNRVLEHSEEIVENFRAEIELLKSKNPHISEAPPEVAEKLFLISILDLLKYGVDPELGKVKMEGK